MFVNFQVYKLDLEMSKKPEIKLQTYIRSQKKQEKSRKTPTSVSLTTLKPLTMWITTNCGRFLKKWEYQTTLPASWQIYMQVRKQQLELDIEQQRGTKLGKGYIKAIWSSCLFNFYAEYIMKMPHWREHKLESRFQGETLITSDMHMTPPLWQKVKRN